MKMGWRMAWILAGLLLVPGVVRAHHQTSPVLVMQEKADVPNVPAMTHLRVDLILAEYSGEKKISSLPYTIYVGVGDTNHPTPGQSIRMGVRVPIATNAEGNQFNYESVGTNIDCRASAEADGRYRIEVTIDRSSIYSPDEGGSSGEQVRISGGHPIMRSFNSRFDLGLRDGEAGEGISATDPFNGHVLKVSVTIHVVK
jgi:hypothetical protein